MPLKKNIRVGKIRLYLFFLAQLLLFFNFSSLANDLEGNYTNIKILDKVSSKNSLLKIKIGEEVKFKNLKIKPLRCKNSEFDDSPEIAAYLQVKDSTNKKKDEVFVFNGWTFSSSPSISLFDHPVYDIWLIKCY